jgi:hypothetical protein
MKQSAETRRRWAPWWLYVGVFLALNYLRIWFIPFGTVPEWVDVVFALAIAAVVTVTLTAAYNRSRR